MAPWRRKALDSFPELASALQDPALTVSELYLSLLPMLRAAHVEGTDDVIKRIYGFAEWCRAQQAKDLRNAAGVAFYERLFDAWSDRDLVVPWLSPGAIRDSLPLWKARLPLEQFDEVRLLIERRTEPRWREYSSAMLP